MASTLKLTCVGDGRGAYFVDGGRPGHRDRGVIGGGAADPVAAATANRLLDQPPTSCCLELTLAGGQWELSGKGQIVLTGADMGWRLNGSTVERYRILYLDGDFLLTGKVSRDGCRAYLAVNGNWDLPRVMGSVERGLPGTLGISRGGSVVVSAAAEAPFRNAMPPPVSAQPLRLPATPGPEWPSLRGAVRRWLLQETFTVSPRSDRQGIRLLSVAVPNYLAPGMLSSPVLPGTVQLTPAGPILLGPDAQTIGGYPRVLQVEQYWPAFRLLPGQRLIFNHQKSD